MVTFPPCKINLGLHIIRKRQDGYHDIETCFYPVPWTDILEIIPSDELTFTSTGLAIPGKGENLCMKAYHLLKEDFHLQPVKIHLHKIIPIGAGLGGGSADAAYTLLLLNQIFQLHLSAEVLSNYAVRLGSDCSFFIQDKPMLGTHKGDRLEPVNVSLKDKFLVLINPGIQISTSEAYAQVVPAMPEHSIRHILEQPGTRWKDMLVNDFEISVLNQYPAIKEIKQKLYLLGAEYACMSGSGSTVFGIFDEPVNVAGAFSGYTMWTGTLLL